MLRVNGLFGWIEANDRRSVALFAGFVAAFQVAAALALYFPLAAFDPEHAPVFGWGGYATRYVPLATLAAAIVFAAQMLWHVHAVRKLVAFDFVDDRDEPRLCRIVETLAIGMGLPAPYVGVSPSPALNAFACGIRRRDAVVVVTRGLIDGLDDDELAAVIAHELAHVANGDIRLIAAANVCLTMLGWLVKPRMRRTNRLTEFLSLPILIVVLPSAVVFVLIIAAIAQGALRAGRLVRLLIASAREFVADAAAVEATHNPAALVSALGKIAGRSRIADLPPGRDAMMIDGDVGGALATHPSIDARIRAIVAVTGSMALIAPTGRDTRPAAQRAAAVPATASPGGTRRRASTASALAASDDPRNWLGLTPTMSLGGILAVAAFVGLHARDLGHPAALLAPLDPRPFTAVIAVAARGVVCDAQVIGIVARGASFRDTCGPDAMRALIAEHRGAAGPLGPMLSAMEESGGTFKRLGSDRPR
ncbi:M48 family metalloprotease [uncultured Methylobacterium sp.]|uniref:M48 family metalloprotease n=1 Tax=uncultured Methylobacterium sp. TaxID=157278 RepID=UPI0035CAEE76